MIIRVEALQGAIDRLPTATENAPSTITISVPEFRSSAQSYDIDAVTSATVAHFQQITFRKRAYGEGKKRWFEWVLEVKP